MAAAAAAVKADPKPSAAADAKAAAPVAPVDGVAGKIVRVYCYGDSLTEGWYDRGFGSAPYADTTQKVLDALIPAAPAAPAAAAGAGAAVAAPAPAAPPAWASQVRAFEVDCNGKAGDRVVKMEKRLAKGLKAAADAKRPYDVVAILAGTNDLFYPETEQQMADALEALHAQCHAHGARTIAMTLPEIASYDDDDGTELDHATVPPLQVGEGKQQKEEAKRRAYNALVAAYAAKHSASGRVVLLDVNVKVPYFAMSVEERKAIWDDGLHFKPAGYARIGLLVAETVQQMLAAKL